MESTVVQFSSQFPQISKVDPLIFLGSCFSNNIGDQLIQHKFNALVNPFGTLFHPEAISTLVKKAIQKDLFTSSDFFERDNYWFSYLLGANTGAEDLTIAVKDANAKLISLNEQLKSANLLVLTLGTAYGFEKDGSVVANCHKMPSSLFSKKLSTVNELIEDQNELIESLSLFNSDLKIQYTVSPVRHLKEGLSNNSRSKSTLILLCHELMDKHNCVEYLPVYEYVIDELRSYSFFKSDAIHLNDQGIDKVFKRFETWRFSSESSSFIKSVQQIKYQLNHTSLYPKSKSNLLFLKQLIHQMEEHNLLYKSDWTTEIQRVKEQLSFLE